MTRVIQAAAGVALCFACASWGRPADAQQPNPAELARPAVCDQFNIDGRGVALAEVLGVGAEDIRVRDCPE